MAAEHLAQFTSAQYGPEVHGKVTLDPATIAVVSALAHRAVIIDMWDAGRDAEMLEMFHFNNGEREQPRDGFGLGQAGLVGLKRWVAETFVISRERAQAV